MDITEEQWEIVIGDAVEIYSGDEAVCACGCGDAVIPYARLIAAAPLLLRACEAEEQFAATENEYFRQAGLGNPPSEGWRYLTIADVHNAQKTAHDLRRRAVAKARGVHDEKG